MNIPTKIDEGNKSPTAGINKTLMGVGGVIVLTTVAGIFAALQKQDADPAPITNTPNATPISTESSMKLFENVQRLAELESSIVHLTNKYSDGQAVDGNDQLLLHIEEMMNISRTMRPSLANLTPQTDLLVLDFHDATIALEKALPKIQNPGGRKMTEDLIGKMKMRMKPIEQLREEQ